MRVLLVDDEPRVAQPMARFVRGKGHQVDVALTVPDAIARALATDYDVVVCDLFMPPDSGLQVADALEAAGKTTPVILMSGHVPEQLVGVANDHPRVTAVIAKTSLPAVLIDTIAAAGAKKPPP